MQEVDILITGGRILTLNADDTIIDVGAIAIDGDTIVAVGDNQTILNRYTGRTVIPADRFIVMPGLVNAHTHAAMTCFAASPTIWT